MANVLGSQIFKVVILSFNLRFQNILRTISENRLFWKNYPSKILNILPLFA